VQDGPYGFDDAAAPFDAAIGAWTRMGDRDALVEVGKGLVQRALSCGFTGLVMLQGLLESSNHDWVRNLHAGPFHPSYYGMMVASFLPERDRGARRIELR
jgi:aromatic ring-opening dioxygenase LigB subunit